MYIIKLAVYMGNLIFQCIHSFGAAPVTIRWEICMHAWQPALSLTSGVVDKSAGCVTKKPDCDLVDSSFAEF